MSSHEAYCGTASESGVQPHVWSALNEMDGPPDASYGSVLVPGDSGPAASKTLKFSNFNFNIPLGSTIQGIRATVTMAGDSHAEGTLQLTGLVTPGSLKSFSIDSESGPVFSDEVYGGPTDLWTGAAPTIAELNSAGFGINLQVTTPGGADSVCHVDACKVTIFFTGPGTVTGTTPTGGISAVSYGTNEQVASTSVAPRLRYEATSIQPKTFAAGSGTLAPLTPVAYNTSTNFWEKFASGGANGTGTIKGFVGPDPIVLAAGNEVLGNVIMGGTIHLADIPIIAGYTLAQLKTALTGTVRGLGYKIQGMEKWY